jgi:UDPglucose 6-dehydrogenase
MYGDKILFTDNQYDALKDADALLIVTEWSVFRTPDFDKISSLMKAKVIFDGRNLYDLQKMIDCGFYYNSIGRKTISI